MIRSEQARKISNFQVSNIIDLPLDVFVNRKSLGQIRNVENLLRITNETLDK